MSRWLIVSNRLPFSYDANKKTLKTSSGGLVTAIKGINSDEKILWVGSLSNDIPKKLVKDHKDAKNIDYSFIELENDLYESYYNDFCNDVLWPILHYETEIVNFRQSAWEDYKKVNMLFAKHIAKVAKSGDQIWLHDFHLFLVPKYLKKLRPKLKIGFFLHVPFPSSEIYRQLPCRKEILESLLCSDLIGFHDYSYLRHFVSSVYAVLGISSSSLEIDSEFNHTKLGVYPVSIDTKSFIKKAVSKKTSLNIEKYGLADKSMKYVLGVDRLDYTKGLLYKLQSFKLFLEQNPKYIGKVQLIQIAVPSRTQVTEYIQLRHEIEQLVSEINGKFSRLNYIPIKYIFNSVDIYELMALYRSSHVLFVSSKRDGMNLVCLEYVSAQSLQRPGVVLISEFAGAASTLSHAVLTNPYDMQQCADKIKICLEMPVKEAKSRHLPMYDYLKKYTATVWANAFLKHLRIADINISSKIENIEVNHNIKLQKKSFKNKNRVLLFDYDGTLSPIVSNPSNAVLAKDMKSTLRKIQKQKNTEIVIVTGRKADFIKSQFEDFNCYIACEHGAKFFDYKEKKWRKLASSNKQSWYKSAYEIIQEYSRRTPGSFCEKKTYAMAWHYRNTVADFGEFQARKLVMDLELTLSHLPVSVIQGKKVVEVKAIEANKGYFTEWFLSRYSSDKDYVFAIGDDRTDEDLFAALENKGTTVKVGHNESTKAKYYIGSQSHVKSVLSKLFVD